MKLYHGTNIPFKTPEIIQPNRALDFGAGFYATSDEKQAIMWAKAVTKRSNAGVPLLNVYEFDDDFSDKLKIKRFATPSKEWLDFVCDCRLNIDFKYDFDLIIGPVADDVTIPTIQAYINSVQANPSEKDFFAEYALKLLRADRLKDQFAFKTKKSLQYLKTLEIIEL